MSESERDSIHNFVAEIENNDIKRREFLDNPIKVLSNTFGQGEAVDAATLPLATHLTIDVLKSDVAISKMGELYALREKNELSENEFRCELASCMINAARPEVQVQLAQMWETPDGSHNLSPQAIANFIVAVDIAAVATKFLVHHQDYVISGRIPMNEQDVMGMARIMTSLE